jgi:hypothetical protein
LDETQPNRHENLTPFFIYIQAISIVLLKIFENQSHYATALFRKIIVFRGANGIRLGDQGA